MVSTVRAVYGVDIVDCVVNDSGAYVGTVDHPEESERLTGIYSPGKG